MGCGCGKGKRAAVAPAPTAAQIKAAKERRAANNASGTSVPAPPKGTTQSFALKMRDGRVFRFGSRLEAEAENVRLGYAGTVRPS